MKGQTLQEWAGASRIFALVFTDIVDSTTLANQLGDEKWIVLLRKHFEQVRYLMSKYDHHEIKIIGDSFMVVFRDVLDALDFALALQANTGDDRIRIRAGVHLGSARIIDDDMFGVMVNYTKRVESTENLAGIRLSNVAMTQIHDESARRHDKLRFIEKQVVFKGFDSPQTTFVVRTKDRKSISARPKTDEGIIDELPPEAEKVARRILNWSRERFSRIDWRDASFVPVLEYGADRSHNPITVYCRGRVARVGIKFGRMKNRNGLSNQTRTELLQRLIKSQESTCPKIALTSIRLFFSQLLIMTTLLSNF